MGPGAPIAQFVNFLLERGRASRIISVGGISALELPLESSRTERLHIDPGSFAESAANAELFRGAIVLCLGTFDSIANPQPLLDSLARLRDSADFMLFCVKDRVRHTGFAQGKHSTSPPVWAAEAFAQALYDAGFVESRLMGYVSADGALEPKRDFLVIAGREAAPSGLRPASFGPPSVAAVINTYNEVDIIEAVVRYLSGQGIAVHIFDNWSTDGTYEKCERLVGEGACVSLQRFPAAPSEHYQWVAQLDNTAQFAAKLNADWVLHYDADEIRCAPWRGVSLHEGIAFVDSLGYNAIDFTVLNFAFTDAVSPDRFNADQVPFFEFGRDPPYFSQVKAWRSRGRPVDLSGTGGHEARFADRKIFPLKFLTKHYSLRSSTQATRKIFADRLPRIASERQALGWHTHYDYYAQARAIEPWHPWELQRFDEASFYAEHLLEGIAGIGVERSSLVLPNQRTTAQVVARLTAALNESRAQLAGLETSSAERVAELEVSHAKRIAQLEGTHAKRVAQLEGAHAKRAAELEGSHAKRIVELESSHRAALDESSAQLAALEASSARRIAALESSHRAALNESRVQLAALEASSAKRIAELESFHRAALDESSAQLAALEASSARRIAELESSHAERIAEIEQQSFRWRVSAALGRLDRSLRRFNSSRNGIKLSAILRHPRNSFKRKVYRAKRMSEVARIDQSPLAGPEDLLTYLRARYPHANLEPISTGKEYIERFAGRGIVLSGYDVARTPELRALVWRIGALASSAPSSGSPTVSIIVPVYNQVVHTLVCLISILSQPTVCTYEILVADDASSDGTEDVLKSAGGCIRYIRNPRNLGFLRSCNSAATRARGEYLFFLNNDTQVLPGAIDTLVELARARPDAGLVGSKLIYPNGHLQEAGGIIWNDASAWNFGWEQSPADPAYNYVRDVDYISGAAILICRKLWAELEGFDELFVPAYCEDSDLALRIHSRGLKVLYQPLSEVVHYEGVSHGTDVSSGGKAYQIRNMRHLKERWLPVLEKRHFPNGTRVIRAKDRAFSRPILLIIDHYVPEPDRDAGSRTMLEFIRTFVDLGYVVKFLPQNGYYNPAYAPMFEQMGVEMLSGLSQQRRLEWLQINGPEIDHVLLSRPTVAPEYIPQLRRLTKARLGYYGHDLHCARMQLEAKVTGDSARDAAAAAMAQTERAIWRAVDVVLYPSQEEVDTVRSLEPAVHARAVPPYAFDDAIAREAPPTGHSIVFVAGFGHTPNIDAAIWLVEEILPLIRARLPDATISLTGSNPNEKVKALASAHVEVTGHVSNEELARRYATARLAVVPLRFGAGIKLKVLEAMRFGVPVVTTPVGTQGLREIADIIAVCSEAKAFADAAINLLTNNATWTRQSAASADYVARKFSRRALRASLAKAFPGDEGEAMRLAAS